MKTKNQMCYEVREFWLYGVCDVSPKMEEFVRQNEKNPDELIKGFMAYTKMLRHIYSNYAVFEVTKKEHKRMPSGLYEDAVDNAHNLKFTQRCLLAIMSAGILEQNGDAYFLRVDKETIKKDAKGSYLDFLGQLGFHFCYLKNGKESAKFAGCDAIEVYHDDYNAAFLAHKYAKNYCVEHKQGFDLHGSLAFADFDSIFFGRKTPIESMDDLPQPFLNCAWDKKEILTRIVKSLYYNPKLRTELVCDYAIAIWYLWVNIVKSGKGKGERRACIHVLPDYLLIHLQIPVELSKQLINKESKLPEWFRDALGKDAGIGFHVHNEEDMLFFLKIFEQVVEHLIPIPN